MEALPLSPRTGQFKLRQGVVDETSRILRLEDDRDYCALVRVRLENEGLPVEVDLVSDYADFIAAMVKEAFDLILADYQLPTRTGLQAVRAARPKCPDTPFSLVSGTMGEQAAIEGLKPGAADSVLKLWPERLVSNVRRTLVSEPPGVHVISFSSRLTSSLMVSVTRCLAR